MHENTTKSQNNPTTQKDVRVDVLTEWVMPDQIADLIERRRLTAAQIVKIEVDTATGKVGLGIAAAGMDIRTKSMFRVGFDKGDYIANIVHVNGLFFTEETPNIGTCGRMGEAIEALMRLPDAKTGKPVTDLYTPTPSLNGRLITALRIPDKGVMRVLNPVGKNGIASVRYDKDTDILLSVFVNESGDGFAIGAISAAGARFFPEQIATAAPWTIVAKQTDQRLFASLGRPKATKADETKIVVNLEGGYERLLTVKRDAQGKFSGTWGEEQKTQNFGIGFLNGTDNIYASYKGFDKMAEVYYDAAAQAHPVAQSYLLS